MGIPLIIQIALHILYGVAAAREHMKWVLVYVGGNIVIILLLLVLITYLEARNVEKKFEELPESTIINQSHIQCATLQVPKNRTSHLTEDAEHEFRFITFYKKKHRKPSSGEREVSKAGPKRLINVDLEDDSDTASVF